VRHTAGLLIALALILSTAALVATTAREVDPGLYDASLYQRYWEDMHIAVGLWRTGDFPVFATTPGAEPAAFFGSDRSIKRATRRAAIAPWHAWWTLPPGVLDDLQETRIVRRFDDSGRPLVLGLAFRVLGGVAPLLPFWLGALGAIPVLAWASIELALEARPWAAIAVPLLIATSPFVGEALAASYSAAGFYVLAMLTLVAFAVPCFGARPLTPRGLLLRAALAGAVLAMCVLCRAGSLTLAPGFGAALLAGSRRATDFTRGRPWPRPSLRAAALALVAAIVLALPTLAARAIVARWVASTFRALGHSSPESQQHAFWWGVWTGLGDFDREKGYRWRDRNAAAAVAEAGGPKITSKYYDASAERILRDMIVRDIRRDPTWYAGILVRRVLATVSLRKLWPWGPIGGRSIASSTTWNEGVMDAYYALVTPVDWMGVGRWRWELPIPFLIAPVFCLLVWAARGRAAGAAEARRDLALLGSIAVAALVQPVIVSTASGIEPQVFGLTYLVGMGLFVDRVGAAARRSASSRSTIRP
jgi:hypothetical protein